MIETAAKNFNMIYIKTRGMGMAPVGSEPAADVSAADVLAARLFGAAPGCFDFFFTFLNL